MKHYSISQRKKSRGNMTWYGRTFEGGVLVKEESLFTERKSDAKAWLDTMNAARFLPENMFATKKNDRGVEDAVKAFIRSKDGLSPNTLHFYRSCLKMWLDWTKSKKIATLREFTREMAVEYATYCNGRLSAGGAFDYIRMVEQVVKWSASTYEMEDWDPMKSVKKPKKLKRQKAFWTPEEIDAILDKAPTPEFRLFWALMAFAGLRHAEACSFGPSMVEGNRIRVVGKGNKEAFLPIGRRLKEELSRVQLSERMFRGYKYIQQDSNDLLRDSVGAAGLDNSDATCHKFRHSFASNLGRAKVSPKVVQQLMRHSDIGTTLNVYSHLLEDDLMDAVNSV